ncbi:hypothetical protein BUALT_Bualt03G0228700 [Buddleja alternifolia]|uniref:Retrovirus-related Pol polyprotein from transposon TNT 1-94-like beta-barrel domain-containing protein n=1 Tax=Buddleja alternifolia TaxID=168488 RepID=A0AAV6Y435_9LAMI|nr:hypothetical protein BUALT_Bualt03G0228700 [Buddleja alternifolia]
MGEKGIESSGSKSVPIVVQSEGAFNAGIILTESNYDVWSQLMEMHIAEREKLSYIHGKTKPPTEAEEGYKKWYAENQKVKRWLLMSMSPEIMKRYLRLPTAREIWNALSKAFYDGSDELQVFALNQKAFTTKQNEKSLSEFYGELTGVFQELDHRDKVVMKDPDDVLAYRKSIERLRVHIFLAGLDDVFEQIRGEILRKDSIPNLEESYALIRREAVRRETLKGESGNSEPAAMITQNKSRTAKGFQKSTYKCTQCNMTGHTKDCCYEIVGYPDWWDHNRAPRKKNSKKNPTAAVAETNIDGAEITSGLVTSTENSGKVFNVSTPVYNSTWIIDSGATNHMTFDSKQVKHVKSSSKKIVSTANGNEAPIIGEGSLTLTNTLNLDSVLVVPSLDYNLLSVSQITTALSCVVIFWPNLCFFKDIQTKQTIGCGIRRGNLYYLDLMSKSCDKLHQVLVVDGSKAKGENQKEIQTLDYDFHGEYDYHLVDSTGVNDLNMSAETLEHEGAIETDDISPLTEESETLADIPHQSFTEDVPILETEPPRKQLPERLTRAFKDPLALELNSSNNHVQYVRPHQDHEFLPPPANKVAALHSFYEKRDVVDTSLRL